MGAVVRGVDDMGVVPVDAVVKPDILRNGIGGEISIDGAGLGLSGGRGGSEDGKRVGCAGTVRWAAPQQKSAFAYLSAVGEYRMTSWW